MLDLVVGCFALLFQWRISVGVALGLPAAFLTDQIVPGEPTATLAAVAAFSLCVGSAVIWQLRADAAKTRAEA